MTCFQNILVGIDLTRCQRLDVSALGPVTENTLRQARWLARQSKGRLTLLAALNKHSQPWHLIDPRSHAELTLSVEEAANRVLEELVARERKEGIDARAVLAYGKGWVELLHQVLRDRHDVLVVGSRKATGLRRALFGSTGLRLLRHCPCPVWVARVVPEKSPRRILVATDLSPASERALQLGVALARLADGSQLHILHVVDYPLDHVWSTGLSDSWTEAYRRQVRSEAEATIRAQLGRRFPPGNRAQIHFIDEAGVPDDAILQFIHDHAIDLLILGTVGRGGLAGIFLGNVADRLLPEVPCSILAVKPLDFPCLPPVAGERGG